MPHRTVGQHRMRLRCLRRAITVFDQGRAGQGALAIGLPAPPPLKIPATPGSFAASATSSRVTVAAACGLRSTTPNSMPGSTISSV